jgi:hypothetical protein
VTPHRTFRFERAGVAAHVDAVHNVTAFDEDELVAAVGTAGPVSIAFQADAHTT